LLFCKNKADLQLKLKSHQNLFLLQFRRKRPFSNSRKKFFCSNSSEQCGSGLMKDKSDSKHTKKDQEKAAGLTIAIVTSTANKNKKASH
jgi:hypothetical protein